MCTPPILDFICVTLTTLNLASLAHFISPEPCYLPKHPINRHKRHPVPHSAQGKRMKDWAETRKRRLSMGVWGRHWQALLICYGSIRGTGKVAPGNLLSLLTLSATILGLCELPQNTNLAWDINLSIRTGLTPMSGIYYNITQYFFSHILGL